MKRIHITVELMSAIRPTGIQKKAMYTFRESITLNQLLDYFKFTPSEKNHLIVIVNKLVQNSLEYSIKDGDEVFVTVPIGGG
jgi:two-component sensor histidine kinase